MKIIRDRKTGKIQWKKMSQLRFDELLKKELAKTPKKVLEKHKLVKGSNTDCATFATFAAGKTVAEVIEDLLKIPQDYVFQKEYGHSDGIFKVTSEDEEVIKQQVQYQVDYEISCLKSSERTKQRQESSERKLYNKLKNKFEKNK